VPAMIYFVLDYLSSQDRCLSWGSMRWVTELKSTTAYDCTRYVLLSYVKNVSCINDVASFWALTSFIIFGFVWV
jgi:hypothetical protein